MPSTFRDKSLMATENPQSDAPQAVRLTITYGAGEELPAAAQVKDGNHMNQSAPYVIALKETPTS